ncbi:MAG TPA: hypothetical protein VFX79_01185 [Candidatus Saccharimonadales bacterium]|nr:hypothetical protein [Candidatus Saccharimonadales bacterium]
MAKRTKPQSVAYWFKNSVWSFPFIVVVSLIILTVFQIHGSSVGMYHKFLYGENATDSSLIYGQPKPIRADEWKGWTPLTVLQSKTGFNTYNTELGSGRDLTLRPEAPYKDWSTAFKPQNLSFFVLPFENAFAFRWWFIIGILMVSAYFFLLRMFNNKKTLSILLSVSFALSPFLLWWYQMNLFLPLAYAFLLMILGMRIINKEKIPRIKAERVTNILYVTGLSYLGICFGLVLYVPFLIPIAIIIFAFLLGYLLDKKFEHRLSNKDMLKRLWPFLLAFLITVSVGLAFVSGHKTMIEAIANSEYPGHRVTRSADLPFSPALAIFDGFLMPVLQGVERGKHYYANQSEAANFILLLPFMLLPGIALLAYEYRKKKRINWVFLLINLVALLFLARISLPVGDSFYKLLLLDRVPNNRLIAGIGFVGFLQLVYFIRALDALKISKKKLTSPAVMYGLASLSALILFGSAVINKFPRFLSEYLIMVSLAVFFIAILVAFLSRRNVLGASLLLVFTVVSIFKILPISHSLDPLQDTPVLKKMESISKPGDDWIILDNTRWESFPQLAGRGSIGGIQVYADTALWSQFDPTGKDKPVYNRQGHALFVSNRQDLNDERKYEYGTTIEDGGNFELYKQNLFKIKFSCSDFIYKNADFVLADHAIKKDCAQLEHTITYPEETFYIYKIIDR